MTNGLSAGYRIIIQRHSRVPNVPDGLCHLPCSSILKWRRAYRQQTFACTALTGDSGARSGHSRVKPVMRFKTSSEAVLAPCNSGEPHTETTLLFRPTVLSMYPIRTRADRCSDDTMRQVIKKEVKLHATIHQGTCPADRPQTEPPCSMWHVFSSVSMSHALSAL